MHILVLGSNGQLGRDMMETVAAAGHVVTGLDLPEIDITNTDDMLRTARRLNPDCIMCPAAYTAVDDCEKNSALAMRVNSDGAANAARAAAAVDALMVFISTDYVFDGTLGRAYVESDTPCPSTVYGRSKLAGESAVAAQTANHQILRIAWLYGRHGVNFVKAILRNGRRCARSGEPLRVVNDQRGTPTWTIDVCRQALALIERPERGVFHSTSEGACTWYEFAQRIVERSGLTVTVEPCTTAQFPRPAPRPADSVLENARLKEINANVMPDWKLSFDRFFDIHGATLMTETETI